MIFDVHVHVISDDRAAYPRIDEGRDLALPAMPVETLLAEMDAAGVDRALLVQAYFTYAFDNRYAADAADAHPDRCAAACVLDPLDPAAPDTLSRLVEEHGIQGVRLMSDRGRTPVTIDDPQTFPLWERAGKLGVPVAVATLLGDVPRLNVPLRRFPEVAVALDHIWGLDFGSGPLDTLIAPVLELAAYPNIQIKVAPTNTFAAREAGLDPRKLYRPLAERFGADRLMWGSNFPVRWGRQGSLKERVAAEWEVWSFLPDAARDMVFGGTALSHWPRARPS